LSIRKLSEIKRQLRVYSPFVWKPIASVAGRSGNRWTYLPVSMIRASARAAQRSLLTLLRDRESDPETCVGKSNASPGACAVAGPLAFFALFALFAVENLADCRGGLRAIGPGVTA
jgi:hypothetical protein